MMSFNDAIKKIIDEYGLTILNERFRTRSILSDYIGSDLYGKRLINVFLDINDSYDIGTLLMVKGLVEARDFFKSVYPEFKVRITSSEFADAINALAEAIYPEEYKLYEKSKGKKKSTTHEGVKIVRNKKPEETKKKDVETIKSNNNIIINGNININGANNNVSNINPNNMFQALFFPNQQTNLQNSQININTMINGLNTKTKTNPKKSKKQDVKGINISVEANVLNIIQGTNKEIEVYTGTNKRAKGLSFFPSINGMYQLDLVYPGEDVLIKLPKRILKELIIKTNNTGVFISPPKGKMKFKTVDIKTNNGYVFFNGISKNAKIFSHNGSVSVNGEIENLSVETMNGVIDLKLNSIKDKEMNLFSKSFNGNIRCSFLDGKINPPITKLFGKMRSIQKSSFVNGRKINFNLSTFNGIIEIK